MTYKDELEMILEKIDARRSILSEELKHMPKGTLYIETAGRYKQYRRSFQRNGETVRETLQKESKSLREMKRKSYFKTELSILESDRAKVLKALDAVKGNDFETIKREIKPNVGPLSMEDIWVTSESGLLIPRPTQDCEVPIRELELYLGSIDPVEWATMPYRENSSFLEDKQHVGITGLKYRSRVELHVFEHIIINRKHPIHYDEVIEIDGELFSPDGLGPNLRNEMIIIEYAEKENEDYLNRNARKFDAYRRKGFVPGRNLLILSCESNGHINTPKLDKLLDAYLLT